MAKCVFVIDPVSVNRIRLSAVLEGAQYDVVSAASISEVPGHARDPDLIVVGLTDRPARDIARLKSAPIPKNTPLLCIDPSPSSLRRLLALRSGARDVLPRNTTDTFLRARIRGLIREGDAQRECERRRVTAASFGFAEPTVAFELDPRIRCVGKCDKVPAIDHLRASDTSLQIDVCPVEDVLLDEALGVIPEAYVIVSGHSYQTLDSLLPELRDRTHTEQVPLLVLYPPDRPDVATRALALGAGDVAPEDSSGEELALRINDILARKRARDALRRSDEQSYRLAVTDPLTGLYNRRYAEAYLGDLMIRLSETRNGFALMIVDIDHFKSVNDRFGHGVGDRVLCEVADRLRNSLRACDLVSRHGGEEFLVILPDSDRNEAAVTAERLRQAIAKTGVRDGNGADVLVTASIGVATGGMSMAFATMRTGTFDLVEPHTPPSVSRVFEAADEALYRAKSEGRNRVVLSAS